MGPWILRSTPKSVAVNLPIKAKTVRAARQVTKTTTTTKNAYLTVPVSIPADSTSAATIKVEPRCACAKSHMLGLIVAIATRVIKTTTRMGSALQTALLWLGTVVVSAYATTTRARRFVSAILTIKTMTKTQRAHPRVIIPR